MIWPAGKDDSSFPLSLRYLRVSSPFFLISSLALFSSSQADLAASFISALSIPFLVNISIKRLVKILSFSKEIKSLANSYEGSLRVSTLFFIFSG